MERSENFFELVAKANGPVILNGTPSKPQGGNKVKIKKKRDYTKTTELQKFLTKTTHITNSMKNTDKLTVYIFLKNRNFYSTKTTKRGAKKLRE